MKGYPKWFSSTLVSSVLGLLFLTGLILAPTTLQLRLEWDVPWRLHEGYRIAVSALHAFSSILTLVLVGALASIHMRQGWVKRQRRLTGVIMITSLTLLSLTGLGIYYLGSEKLAFVSGVSHLVVGVLLFFVATLHILTKRMNSR